MNDTVQKSVSDYLVANTTHDGLSFTGSATLNGFSSAAIVAAKQKWAGASGYQCLADILQRAHDQAAYGKGAERHANGKPYDRQPMQDLIRLHGVGFATGQASKKAGEALSLPTTERKVAEILGAINYLAGAIIAIEAGEK